MNPIKPPAREVYAGMEEYRSRTEGIGGVLKQDPSDFIVREITPDGRVLEVEGNLGGDMLPGAYTHFTLVKRNWETMRAIKEIAKSVGVSRKRFAFAGTKDKRALTAQRVTAYQVPVEKLQKVGLKDIVLKDFGYGDENIGLGSLWGNAFTVKVREAAEDAADKVDEIGGEIMPGFPNYFGLQRFGEVRPITHEVGFHLVKGDFEAAVMTYLAKSFDGEGEAGEARRHLEETRDFKAALQEFPQNLGYEKALLNHLVEREGDYTGALKRLPGNLQRMFVHAYQSHVFNRALSVCLREGYTVEKLPLVGYDVPADDISARILEADGVEPDDFQIRGFRRLSSRGDYRDCFKAAEQLNVKVDGGTAVFDFRLEKGCYATVFLREFMKN